MDDADVTNAQETESASANYRNTYVWATLEHDFTPALSARAIASYTYVASERTGEIDEAGIRTGTADDERHFDVLGLLASATYRSERWVARVGAEARSLDASYDYASVVRFEPDYPFPGAPGRVTVNELDPEPSGAHYAAWASVRMQLADPLTAEAGLRWDDETYGPRGGNLVTPRVNLVFDAGPQTLLRASWGRFQQAQGIHELQVEDGLDRFFRPQYAYHYILGVEQRLTHDFTLRVEGYVKDYGSLRPRFESLYDPTSLVPELRWDRVEIWPESALAEGVELLLTRKSDSPWNGWFNYTWSRVKDREDGTDTRRSWDQTNNVGAGLAWSEGAWRATVAGTYHTGWPTTPLRFSSSGAGTGGWVAGPRNADRLPAYATVDVRVSRDFVLRRGTLNVFAEATNLLDRNNPCCTDFSFEPAPGGGFELDREYRDWLPLVPNVGVLWRF
jgi:outer membrane cobalamin receptor